MENEKICEKENEIERTNKTLLNFEVVLGISSTIAYLLILFVAFFAVNSLAWKIVLFILAFSLLILGVGFCVFIEQKIGYYKCDKCGYTYVPTYNQVVFACHIGRTRYMKCPH